MKFLLTLTLMLFVSPSFAFPLRTYQNILEFLQEIHSSSPDHTEIFTIGTSNAGVPIYGIKIMDPQALHPVKNLVVATHHGNEYGSTEVALGFIEEAASHPLQGQILYVIPVLNTWGYDRNSRYEKNDQGHFQDPNRDYPGPCKSQSNFSLKSTASLARFIASNDIINVATLHTHAELVLYPWGLSTEDVETRYTGRFIQMGNAATAYSHYTVGNSTAALYPADGTFEDFVFWQYGVWSLLFEMGTTHSPNPDQVQEMVSLNVPGLIKMFEEAPRDRAPFHQFEGRCSPFKNLLDLKNE